MSDLKKRSSPSSRFFQRRDRQCCFQPHRQQRSDISCQTDTSMTFQVRDLAKVCFQKAPMYVGVDDERKVATRETLEQAFCIVPSDQRLRLLITFIKKNKTKKVCPLLKQCWTLWIRLLCFSLPASPPSFIAISSTILICQCCACMER